MRNPVPSGRFQLVSAKEFLSSLLVVARLVRSTACARFARTLPGCALLTCRCRLASLGGAASLFGKRLMRDCVPGLPLQYLFAHPRTPGRRPFLSRTLSLSIGTLRAAPGLFLGFAGRGRRQWHSSAARLAQPNGDRLLRRAGSMLPSAHVLNFLVYEFSRRRSGRLAFLQVFPGTFNGRFRRHMFTPHNSDAGYSGRDCRAEEWEFRDVFPVRSRSI